MRKALAVLLCFGLVACGDSPTKPEVVVTTPETVSSTPPVTAPPVSPVVVAPPPGKSFEGQILPNGGWRVKNLATTPSQFTAYYTSFDNQTLSLGSKTVIRQPGNTWEDSFNKTCIQVDLTYGVPGDTPFLAGFINGYGQVVRAEHARDGCTPTPRPTPTPSPEPTPEPTPSPSPTPTPSPTCANTQVWSEASQGFELANSSEATELAWVTANVFDGPFKFLGKVNYSNPSANSAYTAKVVLIKAGKTYKYYLNVVIGQELVSWGSKDISHISYFGCN